MHETTYTKIYTSTHENIHRPIYIWLSCSSCSLWHPVNPFLYVTNLSTRLCLFVYLSVCLMVSVCLCVCLCVYIWMHMYMTQQHNYLFTVCFLKTNTHNHIHTLINTIFNTGHFTNAHFCQLFNSKPAKVQKVPPQ